MKKRKIITTNHHILKEFHAFLHELEEVEDIQTIVPWRVYTKQSSTSRPTITWPIETRTWYKYLMKYQSLIQELFVVSKEKRNISAVIAILAEKYNKKNA